MPLDIMKSVIFVINLALFIFKAVSLFSEWPNLVEIFVGILYDNFKHLIFLITQVVN